MAGKRVATALLTAAVLAPSLSAVATAPISAAATRIVIGGTAPPLADPPGWTRAGWWLKQLTIGAGWVTPAAGVVRVDYPASRGPADGNIDMAQSVIDGVFNAGRTVFDQISQGNGPVTVVGMSQGAMVADMLMAGWTFTAEAPSPDDVRFVVMGDPVRGLFRFINSGTIIGGVGVEIFRPIDTPYDVDVIIGQYDGLSDPPDQIWNLLAVANAVLGIAYVHGRWVQEGSNPADAIKLSSVTNPRGGTTTTYMIPVNFLPLTMPLRDAGFSPSFVDALDAVLRPIIDSAYLRNRSDLTSLQTAAVSPAGAAPTRRMRPVGVPTVNPDTTAPPAAAYQAAEKPRTRRSVTAGSTTAALSPRSSPRASASAASPGDRPETGAETSKPAAGPALGGSSHGFRGKAAVRGR